MPFRIRVPLPAALIACLVVLPSAGFADPITLLSADARGVTLRVDVPEHALSAPDPDGRVRVRVPGFETRGAPGRPGLPLAATLVALPPEALASARVIAAEGERTVPGIRLQPLGESRMVPDRGGLGFVPTVEPRAALTDRVWPTAMVEIEPPFEVRRQRVSVLRVQPFRYDEAGQTLTRWTSVTVRVEFLGGSRPGLAGTRPDPSWDRVMRAPVVNLEQGRAWRLPARPVRATPLEVLGGASRDLARASARLGMRTQAGSLLDEEQAEVRALIDTSGVYSLRYSDLAAKGFTPGVPIARVSVHRHEFVEGANPPYVTIELPIEVDDQNGNAVFDANDRIVVWVQNWAERSRASGAQRVWGDGEVIYATHLTTRDGLRVATRSGWLGTSPPALTSYPQTRLFERTGFHMNTVQPGLSVFTPFESDTNTDSYLWTGLGMPDKLDPQFSDAFPFEVQDLDPSKPVRMRIQWQGLKGNDHINLAEVVSGTGITRVDSLRWRLRVTVTRATVLPPGSLTNGATNRLRIWGWTPPVTTSIVNVGLNWFDVRYYRSFKPIRGYLPCSNDSTGGEYEIRADGFLSRNIRVYDVTDSLLPFRLTIPDTNIVQIGSTWRVRWQDATPAPQNRHYVAFDVPKVLPAAKLTTVTRQGLHGHAPGDYVLITPEVFLPAAQILAQHRTSQGHQVVLSTLESVNDEFNGGRRSPYAVRRYLKWALDQWNTSFVLLMGDGSLDPMNRTGTAAPDWIPTQRIAGPVGVPDGITVYEVVPSDPWYVWDMTRLSPLSGAIKLHDMFLGRLPVNNLDQATAVARKVVAYDTVGTDSDWRRKMLILPDDQYSTQSFFGGDPGGPQYCIKDYERVFLTISDELKRVVLEDAGLTQSEVEVWNLQTELAPVTPGPCRDWAQTQAYCHNIVTPKLFQRLNEGRLLWNYQGHANQFVLTHEDLYKNIGFDDDKDSLRNAGKPFLFAAFSCHPNGFALAVEGDQQRGPSLGEEMVTSPNGGAIASWGSSGYELIPNEFQSTTHLNVYFAKALFSTPPLDTLGDRGARVLLGESVEQSLLRNITTTAGLEDSVGITYHLMGDPATRISIGPAQSIVTANGMPVEDDQPVRLRSSGPGLRLEADLVSNTRLTSLSLEHQVGATPASIVPPSEYTLTPAFPDTGLSSGGGRRFHLTYNTTLTPDQHRFTFRTVDRNGVSGAFDALFPFQTVLRADGNVVGNNELISPNAALTLTVLSPSPLVLPSELTVTLDGNVPLEYDAQPANGDTTGREWTLALTHAPFTVDEHIISVQAVGGGRSDHVFRADDSGDNVVLRNVLAFPNPFDEERGTHFSFQLSSPAPVDIQIRVYTVSGKLIYQRTENSVGAGYRQLPWDGRDAEGAFVSNGVYVYKLLARSGGRGDVVQGRLVKLRRPHRVEEDPETVP